MPEMNYKTEAKIEARTLAFGKKKKNPYKTYLCLPARECLCVKQALRDGLIDLNTRIIAIEKVASIRNAIRICLVGLGFTNIRVFANLTDIKYHPYANIKKKSIDFAYLDLCGMITSKLYEELNAISEFFPARGCRVAVTLLAITRQSDANDFVNKQSFYIRLLSSETLKRYYDDSLEAHFDYRPTPKVGPDGPKHSIILGNALGLTAKHFKKRVVYRRIPTAPTIMSVNVWQR